MALGINFKDVYTNTDICGSGDIETDDNKIDFSKYIVLRFNKTLEMLDKINIIDFYKKLKKRINKIVSVYYLKEDDTIKLYTFIEDDDIKVKKEIIDANLKLWDRFNNYLFDFGVHPKKFINSYELEEMEKIL